jgi:hypothetical protein
MVVSVCGPMVQYRAAAAVVVVVEKFKTQIRPKYC